MDAMHLSEDLVHINNVPIPVKQELQNLVTINAEPSSSVQKLWDTDDDPDYDPHNDLDESIKSVSDQTEKNQTVVPSKKSVNFPIKRSNPSPLKNSTQIESGQPEYSVTPKDTISDVDYTTPGVYVGKDGKHIFNKLPSCMLCPTGTLVSHFSNHCKNNHRGDPSMAHVMSISGQREK